MSYGRPLYAGYGHYMLPHGGPHPSYPPYEMAGRPPASYSYDPYGYHRPTTPGYDPAMGGRPLVSTYYDPYAAAKYWDAAKRRRLSADSSGVSPVTEERVSPNKEKISPNSGQGGVSTQVDPAPLKDMNSVYPSQPSGTLSHSQQQEATHAPPTAGQPRPPEQEAHRSPSDFSRAGIPPPNRSPTMIPADAGHHDPRRMPYGTYYGYHPMDPNAYRGPRPPLSRPPMGYYGPGPYGYSYPPQMMSSYMMGPPQTMYASGGPSTYPPRPGFALQHHPGQHGPQPQQYQSHQQQHHLAQHTQYVQQHAQQQQSSQPYHQSSQHQSVSPSMTAGRPPMIHNGPHTDYPGHAAALHGTQSNLSAGIQPVPQANPAAAPQSQAHEVVMNDGPSAAVKVKSEEDADSIVEVSNKHLNAEVSAPPQRPNTPGKGIDASAAEALALLRNGSTGPPASSLSDVHHQ